MTYTTIRSIPGEHELACFKASYNPDNPPNLPRTLGGSYALMWPPGGILIA